MLVILLLAKQQNFFDNGADIVKVGIGPGSICTTRLVVGIGVPQLSAILDVKKSIRKYKTKIISDGGIKFSGDLAKGLAAGADCIMIGSLFSGTNESPGKIIKIKGKLYKNFRGMGSVGAMSVGSSTDIIKKDTKIFRNMFQKVLKVWLSTKVRFLK